MNGYQFGYVCSWQHAHLIALYSKCQLTTKAYNICQTLLQENKPTCKKKQRKKIFFFYIYIIFKRDPKKKKPSIRIIFWYWDFLGGGKPGFSFFPFSTSTSYEQCSLAFDPTFWWMLTRCYCVHQVSLWTLSIYVMVHITKLQLQTTFPKPLCIPHSACIHQDPGRWKSWCLHCLWPVK